MSKGFYLDTDTPSQLSDEDTSSRSRPFISSEEDSDDDLSTLPYPQPLARSAFLSPTFNPSDYLSTLRNRHQTLSDLRVELRTRSQALAKELLDLVNDEYQAFLGLGGDLRGGEEKVEGVRVGVLGFVKGVQGVKSGVVGKKEEVAALLGEKKRISNQIVVGRQLVEVHTRVGELEDALAITSSGLEEDSEDSEEEDEDEDEDGQDISGVARLERLVMDYLTAQQMIDHVGREHPFLVKQADRLTKIRGTLLIDLGNALKQAKTAGARGKTKLLRVVALYGDLNEAADAIRILRESKSKR